MRLDVVIVGAAAALLVGFGARTAAAEPAAVGVVTTLEGPASVQRAALSRPMPLAFRDDVFPRDRISTGEGALVRVLLGGKAVVTVRELSLLTISEQAGRAVVTLDSGAVTASVAHHRLRPGESIEIRTPNAVAAVRGTVLTVEVGEAPPESRGGPAVPVSRVHVLRGQVEVRLIAEPASAPVLVSAQQQVSVSGRTVGAVQPAPAQLAGAQARQVAPQHHAPPDDFVAALTDRENTLALGLANSILRMHHGGSGQGRAEHDRDAGGQTGGKEGGGGDSLLRGDSALSTLGGPGADGGGGAGRGHGGGVPRVPLTAIGRGHLSHGHH